MKLVTRWSRGILRLLLRPNGAGLRRRRVGGGVAGVAGEELPLLRRMRIVVRIYVLQSQDAARRMDTRQVVTMRRAF